jgi:hypothetical protein
VAEDWIYALAELTNHKLVAAVVPVILGAGLLAWWLKLRDRRNAIRDESLKFVNEVADLLNKAISAYFSAIRRRSLEWLDAVDMGIGGLFEHRLSTRARSLALLDLPDFWREYDAITWYLRESVDSVRAPRNQPGDDDPSASWEQAQRDAKQAWSDSAYLIEAGIDRALRGKRRKFRSRAPAKPEVTQLRND